MNNQYYKNINNSSYPLKKLALLSFVLVVLSVLPLAARAQAATLYLFPPVGNYLVGTTFSIEVRVNSGGVAINAAEGSLTFNTEELSVVSLSKSDSIFTLWLLEPTFSNSAGTIDFGGGRLYSFSGDAGRIITINFKAKRAVITNVNFISGTVLAADGKGTNILTKMTGGTYTLKPVVGPRVPVAPIISSPTHFDPEKWYSNNAPEFTWTLPEDVIAVSYAIDQNPLTSPKFIAEDLPNKVSFSNLEDGIWYFHINFKNNYGWGKLTHRKVLIDTAPPLPFLIEVLREGPTDPQPILIFETSDELSGIEYYEIKIGEREPFLVEKLKTEFYKLPPQAPGKQIIEIKAFDKAGNYTPASTEIEVLPLETPKITKFPIDKIIIDYLTIIALIVLIIGASVAIFYGWRRISLWRKHLKREIK